MSFISCNKCKKNIIFVQLNGGLSYKFGGKKNDKKTSPVEIYIEGSGIVHIKCFHCDEINNITFNTTKGE